MNDALEGWSIFGDFVTEPSKVSPLPEIHRISGASVDRGQDGKPHRVRVQYRSRGTVHELVMPVVDALFLHAILEAIQFN